MLAVEELVFFIMNEPKHLARVKMNFLKPKKAYKTHDYLSKQPPKDAF